MGSRPERTTKACRRRIGAIALTASLAIGAHPFATQAQVAPAEPLIQAPKPASGLIVTDVPNDAGRALQLKWSPSPDDTAGGTAVSHYVLERAIDPAGPWTVVDTVVAGASSKTDQKVRRDTPYFYRVTALGPGGITPALSVTGPVRATSHWINQTRLSVLILTVLFFTFVIYYLLSAQTGKKQFVRRIPGIDAIEEAIGRATEMGRPVLYIPGILDIDEIQTMAGLVILESVSRLTARYETAIRVPVTYPIPFTIAQEMVKGGYLHAGKPDQYDPNAVRFVSPEQFAYVASVTGIMMREKPAAHIFMGAFFAESLLLAETGFSTGAIQVAGTANVHQLPFFVVACDYTLIGEELYAASAYLSGEPRLVGSLKGADMMKLVLVTGVIVVCIMESLGNHAVTQWMALH